MNGPMIDLLHLHQETLFPKLNLSREFICAQLVFARKMSELSGISLEDALIECTNVRTLLSLRVTRETAHEVPEWRSFVEGLQSAENPDDWAYRFYLKSKENETEPKDTDGFGCFWYSYPFRDTPAVRLHFGNIDGSGHGALSLERADTRRGELVKLLTEIRTKHPDAKTMRGGSWLYNIEPYRRLFPPEYIASIKAVGYELPFWVLWGQFLRGGGKPNHEAIHTFVAAVEQATTPDECEKSFPYQVMRPECDIRHFYSYYNIT
jgi:hypothetical protein